MNKRQRKKQRTVRMRSLHKEARRVYAAIGNGAIVITVPRYELVYECFFDGVVSREATL